MSNNCDSGMATLFPSRVSVSRRLDPAYITFDSCGLSNNDTIYSRYIPLLSATEVGHLSFPLGFGVDPSMSR